MRDLIDTLTSHPRIGPHVVFRGVAEARPARFAEPGAGWPAAAHAVLEALGIERPWTHQAEAFERAARGENVLLATPTASGKTLAYLLALVARRAVDPQARAVFVYPLKALARDQLATIRRALAPLGLDAAEAAEVYDGDTPDAARRRIRRRPPVVLVTNPDMLHLGILPSHDAWSPLLAHLGLVALDEAHVYRGIFGAHVHHVLRRLLRLARAHGGTPALVAGSATIGAPREFAETLCGEPFALVDRSGAPAARRHVLFVRPDLVSPYTVATHVLATAVRAGHRTIAFTKARRITELIYQWLREQHPELAPRVASYRSGYLPEERREIERRLFSGELAGVVSTSALESGIDVGGLDVAILVGYPGSLANAWQRIGRAGRADRESLAVLVAMPDALDQYVVRHPEHFFSGAFERVVLDPANDAIADAHLVAAGAEQSLGPDDVHALQGAGGMARVVRLVGEGRLVETGEGGRWFSPRRRPQREIPLRSAGQPWQLRSLGSGRQLASLDASRLWFEAHPGAIYLHAGRTWRIVDHVPDERVVLAEPAEVDYYTQVYARKETEILDTLERRRLGPAELAFGRLRVTTWIEAYGRRRLFGQEEISRHPLEDVPPQQLETVGFWIAFPDGTVETLVAEEFHPVGALHALEHAAIALFPLLAICDRWDLGGISYARHAQQDRALVFVYDGVPGGVGLARTGYARAEELLERTARLLADCDCEDGCPACVISPRCGSGNHPLDKAGAAALCELLAGRLAPRPRAVPAERVEAALAGHRTRVHGGVRGGGALDGAGAQADRPAPAAARPAAGGQQTVAAPGHAWPEGLPRP
ncbi:MAG: DEAD/DEAH box helicase, partial [Acidobacteria bacterium]